MLDQVLQNSRDVLVVDDGSTDGTAELLAARNDIAVVTHKPNRGYGAALRSAFCYALKHGYDVLVTIDCDGQHEPQRIPRVRRGLRPTRRSSPAAATCRRSPARAAPPADRRRINWRSRPR